MPDWITHMGIAWLTCKVMRKPKNFVVAALLGSMLPDMVKIVLRPLAVIFKAGLHYRVSFALGTLHAMPGSILLSLAISHLAVRDDDQVRQVFLGLMLGAILHLLVDSVTFYGVALLAPFNWSCLALNLV